MGAVVRVMTGSWPEDALPTASRWEGSAASRTDGSRVEQTGHFPDAPRTQRVLGTWHDV